MNKKNVFIVLTSLSIGGTEKRFVELWNYFQEKSYINIKLVVSEQLFRILEDNKDVSFFRRENENLIILKVNKYIDFFPLILNLIKKVNKNTVFHYPLISNFPFLHNAFGHKFIISFTHNDFNSAFGTGLVAFRRKVLFFLRTYGVWKLDVLNPEVFKFLERFKIYKNKLFLTTPGSFVNLKIFSPSEHKENWIVFLGRFIQNDGKNVMKFVKMLPKVDSILKNKGFKDVKYYVLGYGELEKEVKKLVSKYSESGINVCCYFEKHPEKILRKSKVFLSLQKYSNYPSKSLLEALASGNLSVVTDVGETRRIAKEEFAEFVSINFTAEELAGAIEKILRLPYDKFNKKVEIAREFIKKEFNIDKQMNYYLNLYEI